MGDAVDETGKCFDIENIPKGEQQKKNKKKQDEEVDATFRFSS